MNLNEARIQHGKYNAKYEKYMAKEMRVAIIKATSLAITNMDATAIKSSFISEALMDCWLKIGVDYKKVEDKRWANKKNLFDDIQRTIRESEWRRRLSSLANSLDFTTKTEQIKNTLSRDLNRAIEYFKNLGYVGTKLTSAVRSYVSNNISVLRAKITARTEVNTIMGVTAYESAKESGKATSKKWIPILDDVTRRDHHAMSSYPTIGINEMFIVGGVEMLHTGDPRGGAKNNVNCRCATVYF